MANLINLRVWSVPVIALGLVAAGATVAVAQPGMAPAPKGPATTVTERTNADPGIVDDVHADRAWLTPTALTQPRGTWSLSNYEILGLGLTYGISDTVQLTVNTLLPVEDDMSIVWFSGKAQLVRSGAFRLAAHGALFVGDNDESVGIFGLAGTMCTDKRCDSNISGYAGRFFGGGINDDEKVVVLALSLTQRIANGFKFVAEVDELRVEDNYPSSDTIAWYGFRFTSGKFGVDVGLLNPVDDDSDDYPLGFPWLNFTIRGGL